MQTTGDILTDKIVAELLERGVWMISVASIDDFHVGMEGEAKQKAFMEKLTQMFERNGMRKLRPVGRDPQLARGRGPGLQLLRRHARFVDRQAVAAWACVAEQPLARDARR